jgi:hypothetical protein
MLTAVGNIIAFILFQTKIKQGSNNLFGRKTKHKQATDLTGTPPNKSQIRSKFKSSLVQTPQ